MNRLPDAGRGYGYGRTPENWFPQPSQPRPGEDFSRFAQGSRFDRRDPLSSSESLLGRAPRELGYGSGQGDVSVHRPLAPELQPSASLAAAAEALLLGQLLFPNPQLQVNTPPSRDLGYERQEGHQYPSNFRNLSSDTCPPQRNRYDTDPPYRHDSYSDSGRDTFNRSGSPYGVTGSGNTPRPARPPVYHNTRPQRNPPPDFYRPTASRQETDRRESFPSRHQSVPHPYDRTRPESRDPCSFPSYPPRSFREEEYRVDSHYERSGGSYGRHGEKAFPSRRSSLSSEPIRGGTKQPGSSHRDFTGRTDHVPIRSRSPGSGGNYSGSRRTSSSSNISKEGDTQSRQQSYVYKESSSFEKRPLGERLDSQSQPKSISAVRDSPSVRAGEGIIADRFKPNISSAVESRLGPLPDDPSRSSIQSRLGPSPLQPVSSIQARLGPQVGQSRAPPVPTEHTSHLQESPAVFKPKEMPSSSEPLSDLRFKLQEQRRASVDRDLKSSSSSPAQSVPLPGATGSLSPVVSVRKPLTSLPLTPESKDHPGALSPSGGKMQGLKSPQLPSHALHIQHSHGSSKTRCSESRSSKSRSSTPTLKSPEGGKVVPSETRKLKPITIKRPKTPTGAVPVSSKKSISPKSDSALPGTEPPRALNTSVPDQKKTSPTELHESKEIMSELPANLLPTGTSANPGMDTVIKPATSSIIKPSTFASKPLPDNQPIRAHATALSSSPSGDESGAYSGTTVKLTSKTRTHHRSGNLPNPFSNVHTSHDTGLKGTPSSSTMTQKTPKSPSQKRRHSGSSVTLSSAQQKHSSTHQKSTPQKHAPVTQQKHSPHPMCTSDEEVVKIAKPKHEVNTAAVVVPGSAGAGAKDVLNPSDQKWRKTSAVPYPVPPVDRVAPSSTDAHTPPPHTPLLQDVLPFSGFDEASQPDRPPLQSPPIQYEPPSIGSVPSQLRPPHVEHTSMYSQPQLPQSYSVHVKESLVEKLGNREEGELDMSDDSDGGLVIDETASGTDDPCTETKDSEAEAGQSNSATAADHMEIPPPTDHVGIKPLTDHAKISSVSDRMEIPPDHLRTPPVATQTGTLGPSTSHPLMRRSQSPSAQLGTRNPIHKQPRSSLSSSDDLPQSNPQRYPNRVESAAIMAIGNPLVTILNQSPKPGGKGQTLLKKLYSSCINVFAYKGRTSNEKVIAFMQKTFEGSAFARDVGPSWNPVKPVNVYVTELRHILHLCGDDVGKWSDQVNRFAVGARALKKARNDLKLMMREEKATNRIQEKAPLFASRKSQHHRKPRHRSRFKKAASKFDARASSRRDVPTIPPITAPYHFDAPPSHYHQAGLGSLTDAMTHPPLHIKQERQEEVGGTWFEDHSENWTNAASEPPSPANLLLSPSTENAETNVRGPTMEHAVPLIGAEPDVEQYLPPLLPSSRIDLDMNLEPVEMDLDTSQELEQPDSEIVPPTDAEFSSQQIEQLQNVVGQLLELEAQVQRTVEHLNPLTTESYDYGHSSALVPTPPFESTQFLPPVTTLDTQEVELHRQAPHLDYPQTQSVRDSSSYEKYPPLSILSDHTPSLPPSVLPAESVTSGAMVEPTCSKNSSVDTNVDVVDQLLPSLDLPGSSKAISTGGEPSEATCADRSVHQPLANIIPEPHTPLSESLSNIPQKSVSTSPQNMAETSAIQSSVQSLTRDVSLSPGEITPSPEPPPIPPPTAESKGDQGTGSFAIFSAEEHSSVSSHLPYRARTLSSPLKNTSSSGLSSTSQLRSARPGYSRRHHYRSRSRSHSPRRRYHQRSHSRTPSPRRSLKSYRGRASRSPSPSRHHHHLSSTTGSRSSYRSHASGGRRVDSPVMRRRYRRSSRSRSRSLSPTRGRRSRRSRSYSPSQRTGKYSRSQSTSPSRGRRSRLSRSPVHSTERRRGHGSLVRSRSGRHRSRSGSRSLSPRTVPKPSTESESEEDIELLRLKRDAIMSMIKNEDAVKSSDVGVSEEKTSCREGVSLKSNSTVEDFTKNIADVPTVASASAGKVQKGDEVEMKDETEKKAGEEEEVGMADKKAFEDEKPDTTVATDDANRTVHKDTGTGQALSVCSKTAIEVRVDSAESKTADRSHPQPQEPVKPDEPAQRSLSQPVRRPVEAAEGVQLTAQTVVRSRSSSRRSSPTLRIRSQTGSPALSPPPPSLAVLGQKTRGGLPANRGAQTQRRASSAKVCPGKEDTWKIPPFCIKSDSCNSATSDSESESDIDVETIGPVNPASELKPTPVSMEEINKILLEARKAAEAKVRSPPSQLHPLPPASLPSSRKKLESTSSSEGLELPSPPASLRPEQKKEYLELQKRLALHKKRKRKEMKLTKEKGEKSSHPSRLKPKARSTTPTGPPSKRPRFRRPHIKKAAVSSDAGVRERKKKMEECGTRITEQEMVIKNSRSQLKGEQKELTSLTNRLTECESEIEEHELKIELLNRQLKIAKENHDKAEKKRSKLQDKVRSTKEKISKHNCSIQEAERRLSREKEALQSLQSGTGATATPGASSGEERSTSSATAESDTPLSQSSVVLPLLGASSGEERSTSSATAESDTPLSQSSVVLPLFPKVGTVESGKEESWSRGKMISSREGGVLIRVSHEAGAADPTSEPKSVRYGSNIEAMVTEPGVQGSSGNLSGDGSISRAVLTKPGEQRSGYLTGGQGGHNPFLLDVTLEYEVISDSETGDTVLSSTTGGTGDRCIESRAGQSEAVLLPQSQPSETTYTLPQSPAAKIKLRAELEVGGEQRAPPCNAPDQADSLAVPVMSLEPVSDAEEDPGTRLSTFQTETVSDPENLELEPETAPPTVLQKVPLQVPSDAAIENVSDVEDVMDTSASKSPQQKEDRLIENVSEDEGDLQGVVQSGPLPTGLQIQTSSRSAFRKVSELQGSGLVQREMIRSHPSPVEVEAISDDEAVLVDTSPNRTSHEYLPSAAMPSSLQEMSDELAAQAAASTEPLLGDGSDQSWPSFFATGPTLGLQISKVESLSNSEGAWFATSPSPVAEWTSEEQPHLLGSGKDKVEDTVGQKDVAGDVGKAPAIISQQISIVRREHSYCYPPELLEFLAKPREEYTKENKDKGSKEYTEGNEGKEVNSPAKYSSVESTSRSTTPSDTALSSPSRPSPVCSTRLTSILESLARRERKENDDKLLSPKSESCNKLGSKNKRKSSSPKRLKLQMPKCPVPSRAVSNLSSPANPRVASTLNVALHSALSPPLMSLISPDNLPRIMNLIHEMPPLQAQPALQRSSLPFERAILERLTQSVADRLGGVPSATTSEPSPTSSATSPMQTSPNVSNLVSQTVSSLSVGDFLAMSALSSSLHSTPLHVATRKTSCDSAQTQQQPSLGTNPALQSHPQQPSDSPSLDTATSASFGLQQSLTPASVCLQPSLTTASVGSVSPASVGLRPSLTTASVVSGSPASVGSKPFLTPASQPSLTAAPDGLQPSLSPALVGSKPSLSPASVGLQPSASPASVSLEPSPTPALVGLLIPASVGLQPQTQHSSSTPCLVTESSVCVSSSGLQMSVAAPVTPPVSSAASTIPFPSSSVIPNQLTTTSSMAATHSTDTPTPSVDIVTHSVDVADHSVQAPAHSVGSSTHPVDIAAHSATPSVGRSITSSAVVSGVPASVAQVSQHGAATPASNPPTPESLSKSRSDVKRRSSSAPLSPSTFTTPQYSVSLPVTFPTSFTASSNSPPVLALPRIVSEFPLEISPQAIDLSALKFLIEARRTTCKPRLVSTSTSASSGNTFASSGNTFSSRARVSSSQGTKTTGTMSVSSTPAENAALVANPESSNHQVVAMSVQPPYIPAVVPPPTTMVVLPKPAKVVSGLSGFDQSVLSVVNTLKSAIPNLQTPPLVLPRGPGSLPQLLPKPSPAVQAILSARMAQSKPPPNLQQPSSGSSPASDAGRTLAQRAPSASNTGIRNQNQSQVKPTPDPTSLRTLALASAVVKALSAVSTSTSVATTSTNLVPGAGDSIVTLPGGSGTQSSRLQVPPNSKLKGQILNLQKDLAQLKGQLAAKTALTAVSMATPSVQLQAVGQQATQSATTAATSTSSAFLRRPIPSSSASEPPPVSESSKSVLISGATARPSKSDPLPLSSSKPATVESVESIQESNLRAALRVFKIEKSGEQLKRLHSSISTPNPAVNVHEILEKALPLSSLSPSVCGVLNTPLPTLTIPESVVSAVENLEKQRGGASNSKGGELPYKESYRPYSSPLLMLQSYRLSPLYRTQAKLPLSSLTYSNKINPQKIMCKFELLGVCNDPNCIYQHIRDVRLSREELVQDLISYQPTLAGCTATDLSVVDESQPELQETISGKLSEYSRNMMQTFGGKIKDEELYALTTHKVNEERDRLNPKNTRKSFVSVEERYWIPERGGTSKPVQQWRAGEGLSLVGTGKEGEGEDLVHLGGRHPPNVSSHVKRYFATGESESADKRVRNDPGDTAAWMALAQRAEGRGKALSYLEQGLKANSSSEKLWVEFLRAKSRDLSTRDLPTTEGQSSATTSGEEWDHLCTRAMGSQPSYAVAFECIQLARTYDAKRKWTQEGLKCCRSQSTPPTPTSSRQCLELLLNSVLLDLLSGRGDNAMTTMNSALFSREQSSPFSGLSSQLTQEDKVVACLSHICLVLSNTLPQTLFESPDHTPPTRIIRKETVAIPWSEAKSLSQQQREKIRELFESSIDLCSNYESSSPTPHTLLRLHKNFILFEFTQNQEKAITMLEELLTATPTAAKLWLLYIRLDERRGGSGLGVVARALETCPRTAELYNLAARAELSQASEDAPERLIKAIRWLEQCVRQFYQIPPQTELDHNETLLLYRKLLGQLVPYTYQPPVFAEGMKPKQLGSRNLVHLWMCYCLLVELTLPSVHGGFHPTSVSDAFESALLSVREKEGVTVLWREYLTYLRSQAVDEGVHSFKAFADCVHRCLVAVDTSYPHPHPLYGQPSHYKDYSFHNEVMDMMFSCLPRTSSYALAMMQKFTRILPRNSVLIVRLVRCALDQAPEQVELAQSSMASFLADNPRCLLLWQMAIAVELKLNHMREARWMYHQAVKALPFHALLWKEFLLFELRELATSCVRYSTTPLSELAAMTQHIGLDLRSLLNS